MCEMYDTCVCVCVVLGVHPCIIARLWLEPGGGDGGLEEEERKGRRGGVGMTVMLAGNGSFSPVGDAHLRISAPASSFFKLCVAIERVFVLVITSRGSGECDADASKVALGQKKAPVQ